MKPGKSGMQEMFIASHMHCKASNLMYTFAAATSKLCFGAHEEATCAMAMALVLATLALAFATVMGMVAAAVLAYFCWSGAIWLLEPNDCGTTVGETSDARNRGVSSWTDSSAHHLVQRADAMGRLPMSHELAWSAHIRHAGAFPRRYQCNDLTGGEEEVQSPLRSKKETRHLDLSPEAIKMPNRSRVAREAVSIQDLQRGYAAHFALWFLDSDKCVWAFDMIDCCDTV